MSKRGGGNAEVGVILQIQNFEDGGGRKQKECGCMRRLEGGKAVDAKRSCVMISWRRKKKKAPRKFAVHCIERGRRTTF